MTYDDIRNARAEAQAAILLADRATRQAADLIMGRLRVADVDASTLRELKRELQDFNMLTGKWKAPS